MFKLELGYVIFILSPPLPPLSILSSPRGVGKELGLGKKLVSYQVEEKGERKESEKGRGKGRKKEETKRRNWRKKEKKRKKKGKKKDEREEINGNWEIL